jgi:hypothetical protein
MLLNERYHLENKFSKLKHNGDTDIVLLGLRTTYL